HREETVAAAGTGVALIAFSGFFFYRGLLARSRTFLGRTVRPFLTALSLAGATGTGAALLRVTTIYEPVPDELLLMTLWGFGCSLALFAFVFTMTRFAVESEKMALAQLPRRARPPNVFVRTCALLLGLIATATAITLSIGAELGNLRSPDRYAFLVSSIACLGGGVFLLQQGLRRARGTIWSGKVRPFLLASAPTIVTIGLYSLTSAPWQVPPDEEVGWIITMIFATVLGIFAGIVPGKTVTDEERATLASITGSAPSTVDAGPVSRGWSALSWIGWTIGTPLVLFAALGSTTMAAPRASGLMANALARADLVALIGYAFSIGGAIAGLLSRSRAPRSHIVRGLFAQSAFLAALASFSVAFRSIHVDRFSGLHMPESDTVELAFASMIVSALLGAVLGAWPARQRSRRAPHSQAPLET
ncbi:MAG TPA: hypothetical protein VK116_02060, partial [Planctomycetota bacterium]|nr:hypothetical protein [Planctomycetota bacterium]